MKVRGFICALIGCKKQTVNTDAVSRAIQSAKTDVDFAEKRAISSMLDNLVANAVNSGITEHVHNRAKELRLRSTTKRQTLDDTLNGIITEFRND
jgi:hypothetical protein